VQELEIYGVPAARALDPRVRARGFFHDLLTRVSGPYYEIVAWAEGLGAG
jgi:hypothetical protein